MKVTGGNVRVVRELCHLGRVKAVSAVKQLLNIVRDARLLPGRCER